MTRLLRHACYTLALNLCTTLLLAVQVQAQPANDDLADAIEIAELPFTGTGTNVDATSEPDEYIAYPNNSVWWKVTPNEAGILVVDTYGSNFDTDLDVWTGTAHPLTRVAFNNNAGGTEQSELGLAVEADTTYYIRVRGDYSSDEGDINLSVTLDPPLANDNLTGATEITSLPFSGTSTNFGATLETDEAEPSYTCVSGNDMSNSVWWAYTAVEDGILTVTTEGSSFNNNVTVWTGSTHPLTEEACARTSNYSSYSATATLAVEAGTTYYIRVAGHDNQPVEGDINLSVTREPPIANNDLADAIEIASLPYDAAASNVGATQEASEAFPSCTSETNKSIWWTYTPSEAGILMIDADDSDINPVLSLWTGSSHPLTEVACNDGYPEAKMSAPVAAGETYYIRVANYHADGTPWAEGDISLSVTFAPPPDNDDLTDATEITSLPYNGTASNVGAVGETGELSSACSSSSGALNAVWWTYTASQDGVVTIDTDGSDFDRVLSLWTGSSHPLTEAKCTDDSPEKIRRNVTAGETYYIRVSGYSADDEGDISLSVTLGPPLANDDLADAVEIPALPYTTTGSNVGATQEPNEEFASCKDAEYEVNSVWWKYTATDYGTLTIDTGGSSFDTMFSIWTGDGHPLTSEGCTDSSEADFINLEAGKTYYIRITGYEGEEGDISLSVTSSPPDPVYVDDDATGANDGSSWADAYTDLHDALNDGKPEIWMAEGTYSNGGTSFELSSGIRVYGGFAGTETHRGERDPEQHEVVLTGSADHVIYARGVRNSTILDGLTISGGNADGDGDDAHGGGLYCDGRAIYGSFSGGCSPTIRNVTFDGNSADEYGGAIYLDGREGGSANATLAGVVFKNNNAGDGGALYLNAEDGRASPTVLNTVFADNTAGRGAAVHIWAGLSGYSKPTFTNVVFVNNTVVTGGGVLFNSNAGGVGGTAEPTFTNATFYGNSGPKGGAVYNYAPPLADGGAVVHLYNSIVWGNTDDQDNPDNIYNHGDGETAASYSIVESGCPFSATCTGVIDEDPDFRADWNPDGPDNTYRTDDDGLRLHAYSPAIDAGSNLMNTAATDLIGNPRVFGGAMDIGAYEHGIYQSESDEPEVGALTGFFKLGSTGATVLFSGNASSSGGLSASLTEEQPSGSGLPSNLVQKYWTITESLDGSFTYNVTFDLTGAGGISDFSALKVYKSNDGGQTWAAVDELIHDEANRTITAVNLTSFSQFAVGDDENALPVELASFEATRDGDAVRLTWQTSSETANAGFEIQRSGEEDTWAKVAFVEGAGTSTEARSYRFTDDALPFTAETMRYRLKQIDLDGSTSYSRGLEVSLGTPEAFALQGNFPNPFRDLTTIRYALPEAADVHLEVFDAVGRRVAVLANERQEAGRKQIRFDASRLASGVYFLRLRTDDAAEVQRMVLAR